MKSKLVTTWVLIAQSEQTSSAVWGPPAWPGLLFPPLPRGSGAWLWSLSLLLGGPGAQPGWQGQHVIELWGY